MIKSDKLGIDSKSVRCAKCKHEWTVNPNPVSNEEQTMAKPPLPPLARLSSPSLEKQQKELNSKINQNKIFISIALATLLIVLIVSSIIFRENIIAKYPSFATVYELVGFKIKEKQNNYAGLVIEGVERQQETTADMTVLSFSGRIKNVSEIEVPVPNVKVQLFNEDGVLLDEWPAQPEHKTLKPGESTTWICRFYDPALNEISQFKTFLE
jgi:hypothetical protein